MLCYLVPPPPCYHGNIESHEKCDKSCKEHLKLFQVRELISKPFIAGGSVIFRNKGAVDIKLVASLEDVVNDNEDENEVPGLTKDVVTEPSKVDKLAKRIWRTSVELSCHAT